MTAADELLELHDQADDDSFERELFAARLPVLPAMTLDVEDVFRRVEVQRAKLAAEDALPRSRPLRVAWAVAAAALFATYLGAVARSSIGPGSGVESHDRVAIASGDPAALVCRDDCLHQPCMSVAASIDWSRGRALDDRAAGLCLPVIAEPSNASLVSVTFTPARP